MVQDSHQNELVLRPSATWIVLGVIILSSGGVLMIGEGHWSGWVTAAMAMPMLYLLLWVFFSANSRLYLSKRGLRFGSLRRVSTYRWSDIACFFPLRVAGQDRVCFTFSDHFEGERKLRRINQDFGGFDRFLPNNYGMKAKDLAELLENWRVRYVAQA